MGVNNKVRMVVTADGFDKIFSIDDWFNFEKIPQRELYAKMLNFVVDDDGNPVGIDQARELFKKVPKSEWMEYVNEFAQSVKEAFVNPTKGGS